MKFKERLFGGILAHRKLIIAVFLVAGIAMWLCRPLVGVDYDLTDYLPEGTASQVSLEVMQDEFGSGVPNARIMVPGVTLPEAVSIKSQIEAVDGVTDITWLDDAADVNTPLEVLDSDVVGNYYKDDNALYSVTIQSNRYVDAAAAIRQIIGEDGSMTGNAIDTAVAMESTTSEIARIVILAIPFALLIMLLTTASWFEPVLILGSIGVAIILNSGSNIIFGDISFVTNASGNILQLAVSLDYSVFLLHRFREERAVISDPRKAMVSALCKSTSSILSSGLTTVIGFLALVLMKFRIGPDMGLALAKGIVFSLISVFVLMPALTIGLYKLIDKTTHRNLMPSCKGFGRLLSKIMIPMTVLFTVLIVPAYLSSNSNTFNYGSSKIFDETTRLGQDTERIETEFGKANNYVLMVPRGNFARETKLSEELQGLPHVSAIISYVDKAGAEVPVEYLDEDTLAKLISDNYSRMVLTVKTDYEGAEAFDVVEQIRSTADKYYPDTYYLAGTTVSSYDLMNTVQSDMVKVNFVAIAAVFMVLLLSMKSISLPVILVSAIETAIWINLSVPYYTDSPLFYIGYLIISSIQLGATVDYAILLTDRYLEMREKYTKKRAVHETIASVTVSILTSGFVMTVLGFILGNMTTHGVLSQFGYLLGRGTLCSLCIVFLVVPGLLYIFDSLIRKTTKGRVFVTADRSSGLNIMSENASGENDDNHKGERAS